MNTPNIESEATAQVVAPAEEPRASKKATSGARKPRVAASKPKSGKKPTPAKKAPKQAAPHTTTISGAVHPELIDDATAYWHLFQTLSRSDGESETTFLRRRLAFAKVTGLPTNQIPQLLAAADKFSADMAMFETQPSALNTVAARSAAVMAIVGDLQKAIGSWSLVLTNYVNNSVKRTIVMIAPMSAP